MAPLLLSRGREVGEREMGAAMDGASGGVRSGEIPVVE